MSDKKEPTQDEQIRGLFRQILIEETFKYAEVEPHRSEIIKRAQAKVLEIKAEAERDAEKKLP